MHVGVDDCCFVLLLINLVTSCELLFWEHNLCSLAAVFVFICFLWSEKIDWALKTFGFLEDAVNAWCSPI